MDAPPPWLTATSTPICALSSWFTRCSRFHLGQKTRSTIFAVSTCVPTKSPMRRISTIISDDAHAPGVEIGRQTDTYRRIRMQSKFGKVTVLVTDGHLPYPYGREVTGYEVANLSDTLSKAKAAGVAVLVDPYKADDRNAAIVQFPGGYIAEIHSMVNR